MPVLVSCMLNAIGKDTPRRYALHNIPKGDAARREDQDSLPQLLPVRRFGPFLVAIGLGERLVDGGHVAV